MDAFYWALLVGVAVLALALGAALAWLFVRRRHHVQLRERFGSEYDRLLDRSGNRRDVEAELVRREQRVRQFDIRSPSSEEQSRFAERWRAVQASFVDRPDSAVAEADTLVTELMRALGYPMADFEQRAEDLSVDHPRVIENYRAAHDLALKTRRGAAETEDLRQAMIYYRALFEDLLEEPVTTNTINRREEVK